ncbi:transcription factor VOZ1-like isoform X2 [Impatiens glandulifera]|uniref:transcription factor VOZ1-like isoform X2 n=1 Tax=Impatiens glandulifera TaxID=253017 RepID=UPI001FB1981A|nr:transcription factor VOZ1-like isoform X2 [Impatiens glandulifera]
MRSMRKSSKIGGCKSASHQLFKDKAKNRVDDLQGIFTDLQSARKDSRTMDSYVLEEQVHQMLREWKSELNQPSPATSLQQQDGSLGSFSTEIYRLLQLCEEEEDDANSSLAGPKAEPEFEKSFREDYFSINECKDNHQSRVEAMRFGMADHLDYQICDLQLLQAENNMFAYNNNNNNGLCSNGEDDGMNYQISCFVPSICPPPSAFLGPKCGLWDCPRPVQESRDYCSTFHAGLALNEGQPGMTPALRPGGIGLKDGLLFAALLAKSLGKDVGIPDCEGAATARSPWNVPELFDLMVLEGETIREWLFFDKPRRAFESGNRKQRSLPDYNGRGWHESRKQMINEYGGLKRSYYMDPQPRKDFEWHLFEYEIFKCDTYALYRLEFKLVDGKKIAKGKITTDSGTITDLQKKMGMLTAVFPTGTKRALRGKPKSISKDSYSVADQMEGYDYASAGQFSYLADNLNGYYLT